MILQSFIIGSLKLLLYLHVHKSGLAPIWSGVLAWPSTSEKGFDVVFNLHDLLFEESQGSVVKTNTYPPIHKVTSYASCSNGQGIPTVSILQVLIFQDSFQVCQRCTQVIKSACLINTVNITGTATSRFVNLTFRSVCFSESGWASISPGSTVPVMEAFSSDLKYAFFCPLTAFSSDRGPRQLQTNARTLPILFFFSAVNRLFLLIIL